MRKVIFIIPFLTVLYGCNTQPEADNSTPQQGIEKPTLTPKEGYVEVEGGEIWYQIIGEGENTPLLCMHGGPGGTHRYFYYLEEVSKQRPVILFDQLGSGRSGHHTDTTLLTVEHFVEQVHALKEHLELNEYYILGQSWGAALQLEYYQKYPQGIKGIVFSSPYVSTPIWAEDADTLISTLPDSVQEYIRIAEESNEFGTDDYKFADSVYWSRFGLRTSPPPHWMDTIPTPSNSFIYNYMWGPSEFTATGILKDYDNASALSSINVPTLFLTGEFDEARPSTIKKFRDMVEGSEFVMISSAGHSSMMDNTNEYNTAVSTFLKKVDQQ